MCAMLTSFPANTETNLHIVVLGYTIALMLPNTPKSSNETSMVLTEFSTKVLKTRDPIFIPSQCTARRSLVGTESSGDDAIFARYQCVFSRSGRMGVSVG
jgi:hypothetical protein